MDKILELRQAIAKATEELKGLTDNEVEFTRVWTSLEEKKGQLARALKVEEAQRDLARPSGAGNGDGETIIELPAIRGMSLVDVAHRVRSFEECLEDARAQMGITRIDTSKQFRDFGQQLQAVAGYALSRGSNFDSRLVRANDIYQRAPLGMSEVDPSGGGFLVQSDFATALLMRIYDTANLWKKTTKFTIGDNSNGIKIPAVDETSRVEGQRFGGIQVYLVGEGVAATPSSVKVRLVELDLKKIIGLFYATDEMIRDAGQIVQLANTALASEFGFKLDDLVIRGSGAGAPLGFLNAPCKVKVSTEKGQASKTILYENVLNMESRMWGPSMANAEWLINSDTLPQLRQMNQVIGTAGFPVYLPPGGASGYPYGTLLGRPVNVIEQAATLGTEGDISLVDMSQMLAIEKGGMQASSSIHVQYLTDQTAFRFTMRIDAQPWWHTALTPAQGSATKSPFVTLASR